MADRKLTGADRTAAISATTCAVFMIAQQVMGKATRDAFFLSVFDATSLPNVMISSALLALLVVLLMGRALTRFGPTRVVPAVFALSSALFVAEWYLARSDPRLAAIVVYLHTAALGAAVISSFWSVINERYDPRTAKRVVARVAGGATVGGVLGGVVAWQLADQVTIPTMLLVLAGLNLVCVASSARVGGPARPPAADGADASLPRIFKEVPYLRQLALLVFLVAAADATIDYVFKAGADGYFDDGADLVTFFAFFHMAAAVLTFFLQLTVTKRSLDGLGLSGTVASLPILMLAGGVVVLLFPVVWSVIALRAGATVTENSLFRSGYELLYTPLTADKKRPTKTLIDVGCERLGQALGSAVVLAMIFLAPDSARSALVVVAIGGALVALVVTSMLHRGYVRALADSLRTGFVKLEADEAVDATTRRAVSDTTTALSRDKLLAEIEALRRRADGEAPLTASQEMTFEPHVDDPVAAAVLDLRSSDPARIKARLRQGDLEPKLVGHVLPLLADSRVLPQAVAALRPVAAHAVGQLIDALLDRSLDPVVRRRLPRILREVPNQRSVDGLVMGLGDDNFAVRYRCGIALALMRRKDPDLVIPEGPIFAAVRREASLGNMQTLTPDARQEDDASSIFAADAEDGSVDHRLEHMFTLLSLVLDPEPLRLAYRAITLDDRALRGTGLEYLENVLPDRIRETIWPYLGEGRPARRPHRTLEQIESELLTSMSSRGIDLEALREHLAATKNDGPNA